MTGLGMDNMLIGNYRWRMLQIGLAVTRSGSRACGERSRSHPEWREGTMTAQENSKLAMAQNMRDVTMLTSDAAGPIASDALTRLCASGVDCTHVVRERRDGPTEVNGVAITLGRMVEGLARRRHRIHLVRPRQSRQDMPRQDGLFEETLVAGMPIPGYPELKAGFPAKGQLLRLWRQRRPDIVHIATEGPLGWSACSAARKLGIPVVTSFMGHGLLSAQDSPLVGAYLVTAGDPAITRLVEDSDCLLLLGVTPCDTNLGVSEHMIAPRTTILAHNRSVGVGHHRYPDVPLAALVEGCLLYTSPSPRDRTRSRMPSSA